MWISRSLCAHIPEMIITWTRISTRNTHLSFIRRETLQVESQLSRSSWTFENCCLLNAVQEESQLSSCKPQHVISVSLYLQMQNFWCKQHLYHATVSTLTRHIASVSWRDEKKENSEMSSTNLHTLLHWLTTSIWSLQLHSHTPSKWNTRSHMMLL